MSTYTATEATEFFRSYGMKCDENLVAEWMKATIIKGHPVCEDDFYDFSDWCRWKGTAYEKGIDDQTKIARLLEEINELKSEISLLKKEKEVLESRREMMPFN